MSVSFYTIGCKLNQAETDEIINYLEKLNIDIVDFKKKSNIAVIRACAVTKNASQTTREMIRQAKKRGSFTITTGCLENKDLLEIDFIAKSSQEIINKILKLENTNKNKESKKIKKKTRSFIKIQTGCNFQCSYCTIPYFRGKSISLAPKIIINNINEEISKNNCQEIVLTGVNIAQYNFNKFKLSELIEQILDKTTIKRIRLGSLDPRLISEKLINLMENERLMPHWHLSLQSGSDLILEKMNRGYTTKIYYEIVKKLKKINPLFSFTTDIIVGFPGETEKEFDETVKFLKKIGFSKVHIFPFSPRPNTKAFFMKEKVLNSIVTKRVNKLDKITKQISLNYKNKLINKVCPVLFEQKKNNNWSGYTPEYVLITLNKEENLENKIIKIKLTKKLLGF